MEPEPEVMFIDYYWFGLRHAGSNRRTGLLIVDRTGVYSTARGRYIRKRRYHRYRAMTMDLAPLVKGYRSLQKLGMNDEGARKEITQSKHRVMDAYWDAAPEKRKARAIERYLRARYKHGMLLLRLACEGAVVIWAGLLPLLPLMLLGRFELAFYIILLLLAFCLVSWFAVVVTERLVTARWKLSRSQIYNLLEFELRS